MPKETIKIEVPEGKVAEQETTEDGNIVIRFKPKDNSVGELGYSKTIGWRLPTDSFPKRRIAMSMKFRSSPEEKLKRRLKNNAIASLNYLIDDIKRDGVYSYDQQIYPGGAIVIEIILHDPKIP